MSYEVVLTVSCKVNVTQKRDFCERGRPKVDAFKKNKINLFKYEGKFKNCWHT